MAKRIVKKKYPCIVLERLTILPGMVVHFDLDRSISVKAVEKAMLKDKKAFIALVKSNDAATDIGDKKGDNSADGQVDLYDFGTIVLIRQVIKMPNDVVRVLVEGVDRGRIVDLLEDECNYAYVKPEIPEDDWYIGEKCEPVNLESVENEEELSTEIVSRIALLRETLVKYLKFNPKMADTLKRQFTDAKTLSALVDCIAYNIPMDNSDRRNILFATQVQERFVVLMTILQRNINAMQLKSDVAKKVKDKLEKNQKEYILREQINIIKNELGDSNTESEEEEYKNQVKNLKASAKIKEKIIKEIDRYSRLHSGSSESEVSRGYIETLLSMPWDKMSKDNKDVNHAQVILDEDHYGLTDVKERILEFLAVRNLTSKGDSPIICLVGPPGTGKTSIAKSVARALNKKYTRVCLGGVRDEAEIRGHRRTYVGAMPGRIVNALKEAKVKNPLMLLDEIDKMSSDHRGDTASALLEVLDPEQNVHFSDHYIELPTDLSEVLFIATANSIADIPGPLRDRMEVIEVSGYTENEKIHIAKEHLFEKQLSRNGLKSNQLIIADTVWSEIISGYTKEAGVRELERKIAAICRKSARIIYQDNKKTVRVNKGNLEDFLGKRRFFADVINEQDEVGIVRGLAWTRVGGDTLSIEINVIPGKGELMLTGQLGDVMKESAATGMSYIRSIAAANGVKDSFFKNHDFHIHIPEGSVPKDGPSAGITMATALFSAITNRKVRKDVAMTGEITLRGRVLPIGGLKEKLLAAKMAGIKKVIVPDKNRKDVEELSKEITGGLKMVYATHMDEVLKEALV